MLTESKIVRRLVRILFRWKGARVLGHIVRQLSYQDKWICIDDFDDNLKFNCRLNEHIGSHMYWRGAYSGSQLRVLDRVLQDGMIFIDVGANQGEFTLFAAKRLPNGHVFAFEPMGAMYQRLKRNIALNRFTNIDAIQIGLWSEQAERQIYVNDGKFDDGSVHEGLGTLFPTASRDVAVQQVPLTTLDAFLTDRGVARIDVLKIDVEGSELHVLRGAERSLRKFRPAILIEANRSNMTAGGSSIEELLGFLATWYRFELILKNGQTRVVNAEDLGEHQDLLCLPR